MPKNTGRGDPLRFFDIHSVGKHQKIEGATFGDFFRKLKEGPFSLSRYWMLRGKRGKAFFWFSSLGQTVQFGTIKLCRIFMNYFGEFVWIEKKKSHYNSRVSLHEAPTKNHVKMMIKFQITIIVIYMKSQETFENLNEFQFCFISHFFFTQLWDLLYHTWPSMLHSWCIL